jgi:hypothetical protein
MKFPPNAPTVLNAAPILKEFLGESKRTPNEIFSRRFWI